MTMHRVENAADLAQSTLGLTTAALKQPLASMKGTCIRLTCQFTPLMSSPALFERAPTVPLTCVPW